MAKLELERGTDVLLLETGDALLLEMIEHIVNSDIDTGIAVTAERLIGTTRSSDISLGEAVTATRKVDYIRSAEFLR